MIISHKHKFIFIKTAKTAGTAIELALSKICGENDIISPSIIRQKDVKYQYKGREPRNYNYYINNYTTLDYLKFLKRLKKVGFTEHIEAKEIKAHVSKEIWNSYYKFCFERNPWEKLVSWYYFYGKGTSAKSIKGFIESGKAGKMVGYDLYSINGWPVVDKIYKLEDLDVALADLTKRFELNEPLVMEKNKVNKGIKNQMEYKDMLTKREIEMINIMYAREIKLLGYEF